MFMKLQSYLDVMFVPWEGLSLWKIGLLFHLLFCLFSFKKDLSAQHFNLSSLQLEVKGEKFTKKVNVLFEDSMGFLWIGTDDGLFRYDGNQLKKYQYNVFDKNTIPNNTINSIIEDEYQNLWIGCESYLVFFDRKQEAFKGFYKSYTARCLLKHSDGSIWVNIQRLGLLKIMPNENIDSTYIGPLDQFHISSSSTHITNINELVEDEYGRVIASSSIGLMVLNDKMGFELSNFRSPVFSIEKGTDLSFWVVSGNEIIQLKTVKDKAPDFEIIRTVELPKKLNHSIISISTICVGSKGQLWLGTTKGLFQINLNVTPPVFQFVQNKVVKREGQINDLLIDQFNNLWIGSWNGVEKTHDRVNVFEYTSLKEFNASISNEYTKVIKEDRYGQIWIGTTQNGLLKYDPRNGTYQKKTFPQENIAIIQEGYDLSHLLIGGDMNLYELSNLEADTPSLELLYTAEERIFSVLPMDTSSIMLGLWEGGVKFIQDQPLSDWQQELENRTSKHHISTFFRSSNQDIWIGCRGEGFYKVDGKNHEIKHFFPEQTEAISADAILSINEDHEGVIWMGTRGGGLLKYTPASDSFQSFSQENGLPSNTITLVEVDYQNNLWLSTDDGIALKKANEASFFSFRSEDGVHESNFLYNSGCSVNQGKNILIGVLGGYYTISVDNFSPKSKLAKTVITSLSSFSEENKPQEIEISSDVTLPYRSNNLLFRFSSLDLTTPNKNQYAYRLKGVNDYWIYPSDNSNSAAYFDLSHGEYVFHVKSTNSDGVWNEQTASLNIKISPPFYLTNWAYFIYSLLLFAFLYALFKGYRRWYSLKQNLLEQKVSRQKDLEYHKMRMVFFTDISHELKTPLTLILNTIESIIKRGDQVFSPNSLNRIQNNILKMNELVRQLMDIRKHGAGEFHLHVQKIDVASFFKGQIITFSDWAKSKNIKLSYESSDDLPPGFLDCLIVEKIISNLLSNALKFTPTDGNINVSIGKVNLKGCEFPNFSIKEGNYCHIVIYDTGIGMEQEDLNHIFDRYYQSMDVNTAYRKGTGIGMELVYKLVQLHHGAIQVNSQKGVFTRFDVYFPLESEHYTEAEKLKYQQLIPPSKIILENTIDTPAISIPSSTTSKKKKVDILIVEDNPELRQMMVEILSKDYQMETASNGQEGLEKVKSCSPRIILSDIVMPLLNGKELLGKLKADETTSHIPVFMLTASDDEDFMQECIQLGAADFIKKPFSMNFLSWKIRNVLQYQAMMVKKYSRQIRAVPSEVALESPDEQLIQNLVQIVEENISNPQLGVAFLADEVDMSRATLYRKLQSLTEETPVTFIKKIRLERAEQILMTDKFYVSEVAHMCGFKTQKYFSKCFQEHFGSSPSVYAKNHLSNNDKSNNVIT